MKLVVGITGATGVQIGYRLLGALREHPDVETHLVVSRGAQVTMAMETGFTMEDLKAGADYSYDDGNLGALIASGSFRTDGMIVVPCSMKTLSAIAHDYSDNLVARAASVCLKEQRKLVLVPREMPLSVVQCRNLLTVAEAGCVVIPPMLTFYSDYPTVDDQVDHVIGKVLMQFGLDHGRFKPWLGGGD